MSDNIPGILSQLDTDGLNKLKMFANNMVAKSKMMNEEEVPDLVINFEEVAEKEAAQKAAAAAALTAASDESTAAAATETKPEVATASS